MGYWNETLYGNDIAQDGICVISGKYKITKNINELIELLKKDDLYSYTEFIYVVADLELDATKNITNKNNIIKLINIELEELEEELHVSTNKEVFNNRIKVLEKFKNKILNPPEINNFEIKKWIIAKQDQDIL